MDVTSALKQRLDFFIVIRWKRNAARGDVDGWDALTRNDCRVEACAHCCDVDMFVKGDCLSRLLCCPVLFV